MLVLEVYFRGESSLDSLAGRLRELLNIPPENKTPHIRSQKREGMNMGGQYYLFEIFGLTINLLSNTGEVQIIERADWPYYAVIEVGGDDPQIVKAIAEHLAHVSRCAGLEAEVQSLS